MSNVVKTLKDSKIACWIALACLVVPMFGSYYFDDMFSTVSQIFQEPGNLELGWDSANFGLYAGGYSFLCVFGGLIICGILLDKYGVRIVGSIFVGLMLLGSAIVTVAISTKMAPATSLSIAYIGCMIFGLGSEIAGVAVTRSIAKWFKGKEMALAMGLEMAIARVGVFAIFSISPIIAEKLGSVSGSVGFCTTLLFIGLIAFTVFTFMDKKLDRQMGITNGAGDGEEEFKASDLTKILTSKIFWVVALLCVLYYSAIFPFQRYGANMLQCNLDGISPSDASNIFRWFPIGAAAITPFLGSFLDHKGKGATMLMLGSLLLIGCHLVFAFVLPATHSHIIAYSTIVLLGISFALVPAALWPSVPKIIDEKVLGSAYCLIFWVQNFGLCFVPLLIGSVLASSNADNPAVIAAKEAGAEFIPYDYTLPLIIFACFGVAALLLAMYLKLIDKKNGYGLEKPNIV